MCLDTLYYSRNLNADLHKMTSLLRNDGILCLRIPNKSLYWMRNFSRIFTVLRILPAYRNIFFYNPDHCYAFEIGFLKKWFGSVGLELLVVEPAVVSYGGMKDILGRVLYLGLPTGPCP